MAGWRKHFRSANIEKLQQKTSGTQLSNSHNRFHSWLPEVYTGQPNRVERYMQYDQIDVDSEVNAALDTLSEFCTQQRNNDHMAFEFNFKDEATEAEIDVLKKALKQWSNINDWDTRLWRMFRSTLKYGDQFFIRDPETYEWTWVNPADVSKAIINEAKGKEIEQYIVRNLQLNLQEKTASEIISHSDNYSSMQTMQQGGVVQNQQYQNASQALSDSIKEYGVDAEHMIHLSLTEGLDSNWPFGQSVLDAVYKTYKQKELLEDAIIIYRVQRAPERRVFYIDVGNMPSHKAMGFVERVKNEIHQRRIPSRTGGGATVLDASYNPLSVMEDYFFAQTAEGRGSKVETLPGGENLGQIDDLRYFTNKMLRALRIPSSYLPTGPDDGTASFVDGRVGTAFIQEFRFTKYCQRLQSLMAPEFDREFKLFLKFRGVNVDSSLFDLVFVEPQSFSEYREIELNQQRANVFGALAEVPFLARRFTLKKYLNLNEDEIVENEEMWAEENPIQAGVTPGGEAEAVDNLSAVGVRPVDTEMEPGLDDMADAEMDAEAPVEGGSESPISGAEQPPPPEPGAVQ
jgi:hypothetical protein|tara:strand:+ start:1848 stop:3563 length:1716 start_codon:yes stop_codon:yes gene_type:complete